MLYFHLDSQTTFVLTKTMNEVFDILNGRFFKAGINHINWPDKKEKLTKFLKLLDITEEYHTAVQPNMKICPKDVHIRNNITEFQSHY